MKVALRTSIVIDDDGSLSRSSPPAAAGRLNSQRRRLDLSSASFETPPGNETFVLRRLCLDAAR